MLRGTPVMGLALLRVQIPSENVLCAVREKDDVFVACGKSLVPRGSPWHHGVLAVPYLVKRADNLSASVRFEVFKHHLFDDESLFPRRVFHCPLCVVCRYG